MIATPVNTCQHTALSTYAYPDGERIVRGTKCETCGTLNPTIEATPIICAYGTEVATHVDTEAYEPLCMGCVKANYSGDYRRDVIRPLGQRWIARLRADRNY